MYVLVLCFVVLCIHMMTSSNGNILRAIGRLWNVPGEFPPQRPVTRSFDVFFYLHLNKRLSKQAGDLRRYCAHYDVNVMTISSCGLIYFPYHLGLLQPLVLLDSYDCSDGSEIVLEDMFSMITAKHTKRGTMCMFLRNYWFYYKDPGNTDVCCIATSVINPMYKLYPSSQSPFYVRRSQRYYSVHNILHTEYI